MMYTVGDVSGAFELIVKLSWHIVSGGAPLTAAQGDWSGEWPDADWRGDDRGEQSAEAPVEVRRPDRTVLVVERARLDLPVAPADSGEVVSLLLFGVTSDQVPAGSVIHLRRAGTSWQEVGT